MVEHGLGRLVGDDEPRLVEHEESKKPSVGARRDVAGPAVGDAVTNRCGPDRSRSRVADGHTHVNRLREPLGRVVEAREPPYAGSRQIRGNAELRERVFEPTFHATSVGTS